MLLTISNLNLASMVLTLPRSGTQSTGTGAVRVPLGVWVLWLWHHRYLPLAAVPTYRYRCSMGTHSLQEYLRKNMFKGSLASDVVGRRFHIHILTWYWTWILANPLEKKARKYRSKIKWIGYYYWIDGILEMLSHLNSTLEVKKPIIYKSNR